MKKNGNEGNNSRIDELKESLYSRNTASNNEGLSPSTLQAKDYNVENDWTHKPVEYDEVRMSEAQKEEGSFFKKFFIGSLIFFIFALCLGGIILLRGANVVSADNVDITVEGPVSLAGGSPLSFEIEVHNKNNVKLELVDLSIEFPTGTASLTDTTKEMRRFKESMEDIDPDGRATKKIEAVLYGEENSKKEIKIKVEYRVQGSNAIFYKEKVYEVFINSSPINLEVLSYKEINSNQEFEITAKVSSNSQETLKNILLRAEYPFGYTFVEATPRSTYDNNVWKLGDLAPGAERTVKIRGKIEGQDEEERVVKFVIGTQNSQNEKLIGTQFITSQQSIQIKKPFLAVNLLLDGTPGGNDFIGEAGREIRGEISWVNNLPSNIIDAEIRVVLKGVAVDKRNIFADRGFYRSSEDVIIWNKTNTDELANISPGETGRVSFSFRPQVPTGTMNPSMTLDISVEAVRASETNVPEQITSTVRRLVKIVPTMELTGQILRTVGPFSNTGPIPPKAEESSTYTIVWTVFNTSSNIANAEVRAKLPSYVKWLDEVQPGTESITYNSSSGELVWKVGDVRAYAGFTVPRREVAFQIELEPSLSQVGQTPVLVGEATLNAQDLFTGALLRTETSALTTRFSTDPSYRNGDDEVTD